MLVVFSTKGELQSPSTRLRAMQCKWQREPRRHTRSRPAQPARRNACCAGAAIVLNPEAADEKGERRRIANRPEARLVIEPDKERSQGCRDDGEHEADSYVDPKQIADLLVSNLGVLDGRFGEPQVGEGLARPVIAVTMATSPKSVGASMCAKATVATDCSANCTPWEVSVIAPPRTERPFRSACR